MANIKEWAKGITFFIFISIMYYFYWTNIFSTIITFLGTDIFGIGSGATTSLAILKTIGWVSFILIWLASTPIFLFYTIIAGARNDVETRPLEILKGVGIWAILMPILSFIYGLIYYLVNALDGANLLTGEEATTAVTFSWIFGIIILLGVTIIPFYFILKGYGMEIGGKGKGGKNG